MTPSVELKTLMADFVLCNDAHMKKQKEVDLSLQATQEAHAKLVNKIRQEGLQLGPGEDDLYIIYGDSHILRVTGLEDSTSINVSVVQKLGSHTFF